MLSIITELAPEVIDFNSMMRITQKYFFCVLGSIPERKKSGNTAAKGVDQQRYHPGRKSSSLSVAPERFNYTGY